MQKTEHREYWHEEAANSKRSLRKSKYRGRQKSQECYISKKQRGFSRKKKVSTLLAVLWSTMGTEKCSLHLGSSCIIGILLKIIFGGVVEAKTRQEWRVTLRKGDDNNVYKDLWEVWWWSRTWKWAIQEGNTGAREKVFPFKIGDTSTRFCRGGNDYDSETARDGGRGVREVMITKGKGEWGTGPRRKTGRRDPRCNKQEQRERG